MRRQNVSTSRLENAPDRDANVSNLESAQPHTDIAPSKRGKRRILFALGPAITLLIAGALYFTSGRYVETDNAYIKANKVAISAEVSGPIASISARENQPVAAGDELFRIDEQAFRIALERADAQLRTVQSDIEGLKASYRQKQEQMSLAKTNVDFAAREFARQSQLAKQKLTPQVKLDEAQHNLDNARAQMATLEQELAQTLSQLSGRADIPAKQHSRYLEAKASRDNAALNLQHTIVRAPFSGVASKVPQIGQYVGAGSAVMSVVATSDMWIEANYMETDLTHVRPGQPVKIHIDTYPNRDWEGTVQSISQATGAEFSVLPPQNASGNWVKIVQRIPVRIAINTHREDPPLRVGMTAAVKIDTGSHHTLKTLLHLDNAAVDADR